MLALSLLLHISLAPLQHVVAVKRTMPMIGMDEDGEESEDDTPATTEPRNALRTLVNSFLTPSAPSQFKAMSPVDREYARQAEFPNADHSDLNGGDDAGSKNARTPNMLGSGSTAAVMSYHGGKIVTTSLQVYLIMYGDWKSQPEVARLLAEFLNSLSGSPWMNINNSYYDKAANTGTSQVSHGGTCYDAYSHGSSLSDADVLAVVKTCINSGLPRDRNGAYFVITSPDVAQGGFCSSYCGWHDDREGLYYGFVGSVKRCPRTCEFQPKGPNGVSAVDGIASIFAHELSEIISDPDATAWYDSRGEEGADKCSWKYGETWLAPNGAKANIRLNGKSYMIQQNWAIGKGCSMGW